MKEETRAIVSSPCSPLGEKGIVHPWFSLSGLALFLETAPLHLSGFLLRDHVLK